MELEFSTKLFLPRMAYKYLWDYLIQNLVTIVLFRKLKMVSNAAFPQKQHRSALLISLTPSIRELTSSIKMSIAMIE
ncbi:MAG TPA: hypothetical protein DCQ33_15330 [Nitrospira sp.]|nr:hypothetical protein [Nitrospira sp.]